MDQIRSESSAVHRADKYDPMLLPFLSAPNEAESESCLARLLSEQTESTIKAIIRSKLRVSLSATDGSHSNQEALDMLGEIQTALLTGLREVKTDANARTITNFKSYVAAVTFNACHYILRRKYPKRWQLKNKLRYLLTHESNFALWESNENEWLCGSASWRGMKRVASTELPPGDLRDQRDHVPIPALRADQRQTFIKLLVSVFQRVDGPIQLDKLVTLVADLLDIREDISSSDDQDEQPGPGTAGFSGISVAFSELEQRVQLQKLWAEILELPHRHRVALLLNLRDKRGGDALALFPLLRVATIREIAEVLSFDPQHFVSIWNELPWDDATIAAHLGLKRQQVINLRQSARAKLARRLKNF